MESTALAPVIAPVTATLTKVLHRYNNLVVQESMRFANLASAEAFRKDMVGKRISRPIAGSPYTITTMAV